MSNTLPTPPYQPALRTDGVLSGRLVAYLIDLIMIAIWSLFLSFIVFVLGVVTLGLAWFLFALIVPGAGILYSAITVGGPRQATIGMRVCGLKVIRPDGSRVDGLTAAAHALFFYVAASTGVLLLIDIVVGIIDDNRRMLHDQLANVVVIRD